MRDFTNYSLHLLLSTLKAQNYTFQPFATFIKDPASKCVILRHDVDGLKINSLKCAQMEKELGILGTYYFRMVPESFDGEVIKEIASLGHEIGYHYEDLATTFGNYDQAILKFEENLAKLRQIVPIETICMHGSPLSEYDNRMLWEKYNYNNYGISGEPYFDINFEEVLYLTDTGRRWDGDSVSIRDKRINDHKGRSVPRKEINFPKFHSTSEIIHAAEQASLPEKIMITIHPQRWDNRLIPWIKELVWQNIKNIAKGIIISGRLPRYYS